MLLPLLRNTSHKHVTTLSNPFTSLTLGIQNGSTHFFHAPGFLSISSLEGAGYSSETNPFWVSEPRTRLWRPRESRRPRFFPSLPALPSQHFTQKRSKLVWSWLPVGEVARWKISPLRGAAPELGPQLHPSHPSRLDLNGAAGEGAGSGSGSYWPQRPLRASRPDPTTHPPALTSQWPSGGGGGRARPGLGAGEEGGGSGRAGCGEPGSETRAGRVGPRAGAAPTPARPQRGRAPSRGSPACCPRRGKAAAAWFSLTCAARAIAHSAADAPRRRSSRRRLGPAAPPPGRTAPRPGKRSSGFRAHPDPDQARRWPSGESAWNG